MVLLIGLTNHLNLVFLKHNLKPLPSRKSLRFGNINARSLRNKSEAFIDHVINKKIDICVVTETWLRNDDSVALIALSPQGYSSKNVPRRLERTGCGTGILFLERFKINLIEGKERQSFETSE